MDPETFEPGHSEAEEQHEPVAPEPELSVAENAPVVEESIEPVVDAPALTGTTRLIEGTGGFYLPVPGLVEMTGVTVTVNGAPAEIPLDGVGKRTVDKVICLTRTDNHRMWQRLGLFEVTGTWDS